MVQSQSVAVCGCMLLIYRQLVLFRSLNGMEVESNCYGHKSFHQMNIGFYLLLVSFPSVSGPFGWKSVILLFPSNYIFCAHVAVDEEKNGIR